MERIIATMKGVMGRGVRGKGVWGKGVTGGILATLLTGGAALADQPRPWEMRLQDPASGIAAQIHWFEGYTLWFIVPITLLVLVLLLWCILRFRKSFDFFF